MFTEQGLFFSGTALVTFGGAYAVLAYVAQRAVEDFGWLAPNEMVRGLALAETTPGPLIMVVQFVAFLGAYRDPGGIDPWLAALIGALLTTWVTFVPCVLFIFLGAPYVERLRGNRPLSATRTGITAAVVGVIANLAVYFALHTLFRETSVAAIGALRVELPDLGTIHPVAVVIGVVAAFLLFKVNWSVLRTLGACAALGLVLAWPGSPCPRTFPRMIRSPEVLIRASVGALVREGTPSTSRSGRSFASSRREPPPGSDHCSIFLWRTHRRKAPVMATVLSGQWLSVRGPTTPRRKRRQGTGTGPYSPRGDVIWAKATEHPARAVSYQQGRGPC